MDEFDDLLGNTGNSTNNNFKTKDNTKKSNYFNKQEWAEQQKQKRQDVYNTIEKITNIVTEDVEKFKTYLNIQSRFDKYSVGNCLLILNKQPNATQIKEKAGWEEKGYDVNENAESITILEPSRKNGIVYYNPKEEYDVSQTNAPLPEKREYETKELLVALFNESSIKRKNVDRLPNGKRGVEYNEDEKLLYMCRGIEPISLIHAIVQELASIQIPKDKDMELREFKTYCVAYMICEKYGVDNTNYNFSELPKSLSQNTNVKEIKKQIEDIRENFIKINSQMQGYFEQEAKARKKQQEAR